MPHKDPARRKQYRRLWLTSRLSAYLEGKRCWVCESATDLELHHADPVRTISQHIWSWPRARRAGELENCIVLCRACHRQATQFLQKAAREWPSIAHDAARPKRDAPARKRRRSRDGS